MSADDMKKVLDNHKKQDSNIPVIGGIINWWNDFIFRCKKFRSSSPQEKRRSIKNFFINYALLLFILVYIVVVAVYNPNFVSFKNIVTMIRYASLLLVISLGMGGIIVLTGADLSASSIMFFVIVFITVLIPNNITKLGGGTGVYLINGFTLPIVIALLVAMIVGGAIGSLNGIMTARFKVHPFIGTMATNFVFGASALTLMLLQGLGAQGSNAVISNTSPLSLLMTGGFSIAGVKIPNIIWFAVVATIIMWVVWNKTKFGKNMFAVGCNQEAARVSGINVVLTTIIVFTIAGMLYGFGAFMALGDNSGADGGSYSLHGLYAIASCVIGGVSFTGGVGRIRGIVFGTILFQLVTNSTTFLGLSSSIGYVFIGIVVAFAVIFDMFKYRQKT